jgi:hypothetical protein
VPIAEIRRKLQRQVELANSQPKVSGESQQPVGNIRHSRHFKP